MNVHRHHTLRDHLESARACAFDIMNTTSMTDHQAEIMLDLMAYLKRALELEQRETLARMRAD